MQVLEQDQCPDCSSPVLDAGDEFVCPSCGVVREKLVVDSTFDFRSRPALGREPLGSFMGTFGVTTGERNTRGITGKSGSYHYLKTVSDTAGKDEGSAADCERMIQRVGERLRLPRIVMVEAAAVARKVFVNAPPHRRITVAAVSAFSLITACRIEGVASVSVKEVLDAHADRGRRVTSSSVIRLGFNSPVKTYARAARDYVPMVLARLSALPTVQSRLRKGGVLQAGYFASLRETSLELLRALGEASAAGKRPCALASSAVYSAELVLSASGRWKKRLTQRDLSECGDTAEYTIREQCANLFTPVVREAVERRSRSPTLPYSGRSPQQAPAPLAG